MARHHNRDHSLLMYIGDKKKPQHALVLGVLNPEVHNDIFMELSAMIEEFYAALSEEQRAQLADKDQDVEKIEEKKE